MPDYSNATVAPHETVRGNYGGCRKPAKLLHPNRPVSANHSFRASCGHRLPVCKHNCIRYPDPISGFCPVLRKSCNPPHRSKRAIPDRVAEVKCFDFFRQMQIKSVDPHTEIPQQETIFQSPQIVDDGAADKVIQTASQTIDQRKIQRMIEPPVIGTLQ